jgi:hypothetical protein
MGGVMTTSHLDNAAALDAGNNRRRRPEEHDWHATDQCSPDWHRDLQPPADGTEFLAWYPDGGIEILRQGFINRAGHSYSKPSYWKPLPK